MKRRVPVGTRRLHIKPLASLATSAAVNSGVCNRKLRRQVRELEQEREILKAGVPFFAARSATITSVPIRRSELP